VVTVLRDITIIFALSVGAVLVCHRLNLPSTIGMLVAGVLAGPDVFGLVREVHQIELMSQAGVVLLLFVIGLEFSLADLKHMRTQFAVGGSIQFFGTAAVIGLATYAMSSDAPESIYLGFIVALSSTAIVLRMLQERAELDSPHGRTVLAALIYQDIAVVPVMLTAPLLAGSASGAGFAVVGGLLGRIALLAAFAYAAYRWVVPWMLEAITKTRSSEAFLLGVFTLCIGIAILTQSLGLSLALGAFLAGLIISESDYSHQAVSVMLPFRDVFMSLFFVSIGMLLDIDFLLSDPLRIAALTLGVLLVKPIVAGGSALAIGLPLRSSVLAGVSLGQIGEFSLVAATAGVSAGLFGNDVFQTVLNTAVMTMLLTPALVAAGPGIARLLQRTPLARLERPGFTSARIGSAHEYRNHVVIVGFGVTGRNLARTAAMAGVPYTVIELNAATVKDASEKGEPIHFGDAAQETILKHVDADKARAIVIVIDDPPATRRIVEIGRRMAPEAYILVRSRYLREVEPLRELGADEVIADELEVSIEVFSRVLARMLVPREDIKRLIGEVRGNWGRMSRTLAKEATAVSDLRVAVPDLMTHTVRLTPTSPVAGKTIAESNMRQQHGVTVLAVTRAGEQTSNPRSSVRLEPDDELFVIGPDDWDPSSVA
jgi:CPA2 family monovalent cation:H+ antiporter-2